jgi:hypothetical protein
MAFRLFKCLPASIAIMLAACGGVGGATPENTNPSGLDGSMTAADIQECLTLGDKPFSLIFDYASKFQTAGSLKIDVQPTGFFANTTQKSYKRTDAIGVGSGWNKITENNFYVSELGTQKIDTKTFINAGSQLQSAVVYQGANLDIPSALADGVEKKYSNVYTTNLPESQPTTVNRRAKFLGVEPLNTAAKIFPKTCKIELIDIKTDGRGDDIRTIVWVAPQYNVVRSESSSAATGATLLELAQIPVAP